MYLVQWLSKRNPLKDFLQTCLSPYQQELCVCATTAQMSAIDISQFGGGDKPAMESSPPKLPTAAMMTAEAAKTLFFDHWNHIDKLARDSFPNDNQQMEAAEYVQKTLAADDWKKLRTSKANGKKLTAFLTTVISRLLIDFRRNKFGRDRPNTWLKQQKDPIYGKAYQLLVKEKYSKREVVEILLTTETDRQRWKIEEVVDEVATKCPIKLETQDVSLDQGLEEEHENNSAIIQASLENTLEKQIEGQNEQVLQEVLLRLLNNEIDENDIPLELRELLGYLAKSIHCTEEEYLIFRLHKRDGFTIEKIAQLLSLTNKQVRYRFKKAETALSQALKQCGVL